MQGEAESLSALHRWALDPTHEMKDLEKLSIHMETIAQRTKKSPETEPIANTLEVMLGRLAIVRLAWAARMAAREEAEAKVALELWVSQLRRLSLSDAVSPLPEVLESLSESGA